LSFTGIVTDGSEPVGVEEVVAATATLILPDATTLPLF
jgi:hypothetical protein